MSVSSFGRFMIADHIILCCTRSITHHKIQVYNPSSPNLICLFCLRDAIQGGESILSRNEDITANIPFDMKQFLETHGGLRYRRVYYDKSRAVAEGEEERPSWAISWQDKCMTTSRQTATQFWIDHNFEENNIAFGKNGTMTIDFYHRGFIRDKKTGKDLWFNIVDVGLPPSLNGAFTQKPGISAADGTLIPQEMIARVQGERWQSVRSFKLEPGDWLVVDNKAVQHGRLPYQDDEAHRRTLFTTYTM